MDLTVWVAAACIAASASIALGSQVSETEMVERDRWLAAAFPELLPQERAPAGELVVEACYDKLLQNTYCNSRFDLGRHVYYRGLLAHANSRITVKLPRPGSAFTATVGVDSNHMTYGQRGSVVFGVDVAGTEVFRSPVMREGDEGLPLRVDLQGATEFSITAGDSGDGIACDQAVWADACVALDDGRRLLLGDMPITAGQESPTFAPGMPFSFVYGGRPFAELQSGWEREAATLPLGDGRTGHTVTLTDPATGLRVRCEAIVFAAFPTVEWTVWLENTGEEGTLLIEDLQGLDMVLQRHGDPGGLGEFVLHHYRGEGLAQGSLAQESIELRPGAAVGFAPPGGRGTDHEWPYYSIESWTRSVIVGVGWPGQWATSFARDDGTGLRVRAGQELTRLVLHPGEAIRTPRIVLQFYSGDAIRAQNIWREWMQAHNTPRPNGDLPKPMALAGSNRQLNEMIEANEANQLEFIDRYFEVGIHIDYWWMDAGWYVGAVEHGWPHVGTWEVDTTRFPRGLRAVSDYAHSRGLKTLLWFEPERVAPGTWLFAERPEWLLTNPFDPQGGKLLNLGLPEARQWLTDHIDRVLTEQGIDLYRQDFNMDPLAFWRGADDEDRQGVAENLHIQGYLAYWDELRRRHPDMLIDTCASGGRRLDLETLRRAVPLWRSDHAYEVVGNQCLTYGLSQWVPYYGTGNLAFSGSYYGAGATPVVPYDFWSTCAPAMVCGLDVRSRENDYEAVRALHEQRASVIDCFSGDFYPLSPFSTAPDAWVAWQFHLAEEDRGVVMVFRRAGSPFLATRYPLRGLDPDAAYSVTFVDGGPSTLTSGQELLHRGLRIDLDEAPGAAVVAYHRQ